MTAWREGREGGGGGGEGGGGDILDIVPFVSAIEPMKTDSSLLRSFQNIDIYFI